MEGQTRNHVKSTKGGYLIDLNDIKLFLYLYWHWLILSVFVCILLGFIFLLMTPSTVDIGGKMQFVESKSNKGSSVSVGAAMLNSLPMGLGANIGSNLGLSGGSTSNIETEKLILQSNTLVRQVVNDLKLHTTYRLNKWGRDPLLYKTSPIRVNLDSTHLSWFDEEYPLTYHQIDLVIRKSASGYSVDTYLKENKNGYKEE